MWGQAGVGGGVGVGVINIVLHNVIESVFYSNMNSYLGRPMDAVLDLGTLECEGLSEKLYGNVPSGVLEHWLSCVRRVNAIVQTDTGNDSPKQMRSDSK